MTKSKGTHWLSLFIDINIAVYFDSFGIEHIPQEVLSKISNKLINHNIFRIQDNKLYFVWILLYRFHTIYAYRKNFVRFY